MGLAAFNRMRREQEQAKNKSAQANEAVKKKTNRSNAKRKSGAKQ